MLICFVDNKRNKKHKQPQYTQYTHNGQTQSMMECQRVAQSSLADALTNGVRRGFLESVKVLLGLDVTFPSSTIAICVQQASLRGHDEVLALLKWYMDGLESDTTLASAN
jgi:hypothetical protein